MMNTFVILLRGITPTGKYKVPMEELQPTGKPYVARSRLALVVNSYY